MTTIVSLRKTLRTVPPLRALPKHELDVVVDTLECKRYVRGERLWRTGVGLDFIGIIQKGEIVVECQVADSHTRVTRLAAGAFFQSSRWGVEKRVMTGSAYAASELTLYILRLEQLSVLRSRCPHLDYALPAAPKHRVRRLPWSKLWTAIVCALLVLVVWRDVAKTSSGLLYLISDRLVASSGGERTLRLLGALELQDIATWLDPQASYSYNQQGYVWSQLGEKKAARIAFVEALRVDDVYGPALNNLAVTQYASGLVDQAVGLQQRAARADPNAAFVRYNLGLMLMKQEDRLGAIRAFKEATRINPNWVLPYIHMGFLYLQMRDVAKAEDAARVAVRLDPAQESAHLSLAIALYDQGRYQEALISLERALGITPDLVVAGFYRALILRNLGEYGRALRIFEGLFDSSTDPAHKNRIAMEIERILLLAPALSRTIH